MDRTVVAIKHAMSPSIATGTPIHNRVILYDLDNVSMAEP